MENTPIFIKIDEYKEILELVEAVNQKLADIKGSLQELQGIKQDEDSHIGEWNSSFDVISQKMDYINKTLREI